MFKEYRRRRNVVALGGHTSRLASLKEIRDQYDQEGRKDMVLAFNFELASEATRALLVVRKLQELGGVFGSPDDASQIRASLEYYSNLPGVPQHSVKLTPRSEIDRLYNSFVAGKVNDPGRRAPDSSEREGFPCELCQLEQWLRDYSGMAVVDLHHERPAGPAEGWVRDHSAVVQWRFEGLTSKNSLMVCRICHDFLVNSDFLVASPIIVFSLLVAHGRTDRAAPWVFTNHPTWRHIWLRALAAQGALPPDEIGLVKAIAIKAEEYYKAAGYRPNVHKVPRLDPHGRVDVGTALRTLMKEHSIPFEIAERKYMAYMVALQSADRSSNWNVDIDQMAKRRGFLNNKEIQRARSDLHRAILNRVKVSLYIDGLIPSTAGDATGSDDAESPYPTGRPDV
jgi:hypothetical protein